MASPFDKQAPIEGVKNIVLVGSGKGGVGKSTLSLNLAMAIKNQGHKVALLDGDLYGPSIPRLIGALDQAPFIDKNQKLHPLRRFGLSLMSLGFLVPEHEAVVWRGPMLFKAIGQFFHDVEWGQLDYLLIDLPPGTGDVALTVAQKVPVQGAVVVCTPQNLALADAKKAVNMFSQVNIPCLGLVENMGPYVDDQGRTIELFPSGQLQAFAHSNKLELLASIPFDPNIGKACEAGVPFVEADPASPTAQIFTQLAQRVVQKCSISKHPGARPASENEVTSGQVATP